MPEIGGKENRRGMNLSRCCDYLEKKEEGREALLGSHLTTSALIHTQEQETK